MFVVWESYISSEHWKKDISLEVLDVVPGIIGYNDNVANAKCHMED